MFDEERAELERSQALTMGEAAFYGPLGEAARSFGHTEADPAAILVSIIAGFGNLVGNGVWADVYDYPQHARLNVLIAGATARARKSAAWKKAKLVLKRVDPKFFERGRDVGGFGSGQKLVDTIKELVLPPETRIEGVPELPLDPRVIIFEEEFVRTLKTVNSEGSIYSAIVRNAYDGSRLEARSRAGKDQVVPEGSYHLSVIGCMTDEELKENLSATERFSGFGNRFVYVRASRSKRVARTKERVDEVALDRIASTLQEAIRNVRDAGGVEFASEADGEYWDQLYDDLDDDDPPGQLGAMIARNQDHTLRISLIYALADGCTTISRKHLEAAYAVWLYCRDTAALLFDGRTVVKRTSNATYDKAKAAVYAYVINNPGKSKSVIKDAANRNRKAWVYQILEELVAEGAIYEKMGYRAKQEVPTPTHRMELP